MENFNLSSRRVDNYCVAFLASSSWRTHSSFLTPKELYGSRLAKFTAEHMYVYICNKCLFLFFYGKLKIILIILNLLLLLLYVKRSLTPATADTQSFRDHYCIPNICAVEDSCRICQKMIRKSLFLLQLISLKTLLSNEWPPLINISCIFFY